MTTIDSKDTLAIVWCSLQFGKYPNQGYGTYNDNIVVFLNNDFSLTSPREIPSIDLTDYLSGSTQIEALTETSSVLYELYECSDLEGLLALRAEHEKILGCDMTWGQPIKVEGEVIVHGIDFELSKYRGNLITTISSDKIINLV